MDDATHLQVTQSLAIPRAELRYRASRAGGPGGQHVNTSSTRIELIWDLVHSRAISDDERARIATRLEQRLDADGNVRVVASEHRSQQQNREAADVRLAALVRRALHVPKTRRATKPTKASKERRLSDKRRQGERKRNRHRGADD